MRVVTTKQELAAAMQATRASVLVPTMGALHAGHASLIQQGTDIAERRNYDGGCVVTIAAATWRMATPLIYTAIGGMFAERSGVVDISLEGKILASAFTAASVSARWGAETSSTNETSPTATRWSRWSSRPATRASWCRRR